jgi:3-hydroxyacyl-[acyl-carrier-protein] dehydratase
MTEAVSAENCAVSIDVREIMRYLPHRYPFLLVDRVTEFEANKRIKALKNVTINEPFFMGHFEQYPVMPGVLIIEALAQTAAILSFKTMGTKPDDKSVYYFVGIDSARFKKPVSAGDQLSLEVEITRSVKGIWKYAARAKVDGAVVTEAELMCTVKAL